MKNLENYGVLEMNAKEINETDGGQFDPEPWWWIADVAYEYVSSLPWGDVFDTDPNMGIPVSA